MTEVIFTTHGGEQHRVDVADGISLMEAAVRGDVPGIDADCGGALACATCHVYVDPAWAGQLTPPSGDETDMLEYCKDVRATSRLSCQLFMRSDLAGLAIEVPEEQGGI